MRAGGRERESVFFKTVASGHQPCPVHVPLAVRRHLIPGSWELQTLERLLWEVNLGPLQEQHVPPHQYQEILIVKNMISTKIYMISRQKISQVNQQLEENWPKIYENVFQQV